MTQDAVFAREAVAETTPILNYSSPKREPPCELTLEESDGSVRIIFAVGPKWVYFFHIGSCFLTALAKAATLGVILFLIWKLNRTASLHQSLILLLKILQNYAWLLLALALTPVIWSLLAIHYLHMYRHWGRVPRILTVNRENLVLSWLGFWRTRERRWPASEITAVELRPIRGNLNWRRTVADLYIRRQKGRAIHFRLSSADAALPARIAEQVRGVLGFGHP